MFHKQFDTFNPAKKYLIVDIRKMNSSRNGFITVDKTRSLY